MRGFTRLTSLIVLLLVVAAFAACEHASTSPAAVPGLSLYASCNSTWTVKIDGAAAVTDTLGQATPVVFSSTANGFHTVVSQLRGYGTTVGATVLKTETDTVTTPRALLVMCP